MKRIFIVLIIFLLWGSVFVVAGAVSKSDNVSSTGLVLEGFPRMSGDVVNFTTKKRINEYKSVTFLTTFINNGSSNLRPIGEIKIKNWFGNEIDTVKFNQFGALSKVGETTEFDDIYFKDGSFSFLGSGKYTATLTLSYGPGEPIVRTVNFWIIPWKIIIAGILSIILYLALVIKRQHKVKEAFYGKVVFGHSH